MNKDVIYIEPEDDITDILTNIKDSEAKIIALVPPKKASVLKSAVNFKLLSRAARDSKKSLVLVSTDSALLKLAAATEIPVAKSLQSKPVILGEETAPEEPESDVIDGEEAKVLVRVEKEKIAKPDEDAALASIDMGEPEAEKPDEDGERDKGKKKKAKKPIAVGFAKYRKFIIVGGAALVLVVCFLVWALVFAPGAKIKVAVRTTARQFSEMVAFTTEQGKQDPSVGTFLLEEHSLTKEQEVEFEATGEKDKGVKATGTLTVSRSGLVQNAALAIPKGTRFTINGRVFLSDADATLPAGESGDWSDCPGNRQTNCYNSGAVKISVKVTAETAGTAHNIGAATSGWTSSVANSMIAVAGSAMAGGTTDIVKIVSEEDVAKAKEKLASASTTEGRNELDRTFPVGLIQIPTSFKVNAEDPVSTPAIGDEVPENTKPVLVATTTFMMYGVDSVKIADYIEALTVKAIAGEQDQTVYSTGVSDNDSENKAFIESFRADENTYTARLKTTTKIGPKVTDEMVKEKSLGRKIGDVQSQLKSINGISKVEIETSFFWVTSVPNDTNKVTVEITVE